MAGPTVDWSTVHIHGKYVDYSGAPKTGAVKFTPTATRAVNQAHLTTIIGSPFFAALDNAGEVNIDLPATNDPDITPINFTYAVEEQFSGGSSYTIFAPSGATIELAIVSPVSASAGTGANGSGAVLAGGVVAVNYVGGSTGWPARPTASREVVVEWIGGTTSPPGAIAGVDLWIRPATLADAVAGTSFSKYYSSSTGWPARGTTRTDVTVYWIGGDLSHLPPSVNSIDIWIRDASAD